ncbi:hypothetical protein B5S31_g1813 [[Candida] boidinii]|nr:hypothetical protein B5S31_g1813 [[Candida] boidinii]
MVKGYICVIVCDTPIEPFCQEYGDFGDQGIELLKNGGILTNDVNGIEFKKYNVIENQELPDLEILKNEILNNKNDNSDSKCLGIYITGSRSDSYKFKEFDWINKLIEFTKILIHDEIYNSIPIVAVCFGHQIVSIALGLNTKPNELGWELGLTNIEINKDSKKFNQFLSSLKDSKFNNNHPTFTIMECHQDIAIDENSIISSSTSESNVENIGSTEICKFQGFFKPKNLKNTGSGLLSFQGHPEFTTKYGQNLANQRHENQKISDEFYENVCDRNSKLENDGNELGKLFVNFILN